MKTKLIEDLEREFPEQMKDGRNYQVTKEDLEKLFKLLNENVFDGDFGKYEVRLEILEHSASRKWKAKFGIAVVEGVLKTIITIVDSPNRSFSKTVSLLCHQMCHLYDFTYGVLWCKHDLYCDVDEENSEQHVPRYFVHGYFFKTWMSISKMRGVTIAKKYLPKEKEPMKLSETKLSEETPIADLLFGKRETTEEVDDSNYKTRLEMFVRSLKGTDVEFKYFDKGNWVIAFD